MIQNYTEDFSTKNGSDEVEKVWDEVVVWWDLDGTQIMLILSASFTMKIKTKKRRLKQNKICLNLRLKICVICTVRRCGAKNSTKPPQ